MNPHDAPLPDRDQMRSKVVQWHDPAPVTAHSRTMDGLDYLRSVLAGRLPPPPIYGLFNAVMVRVVSGEVQLHCRPDESAYNPTGAVHGGLVCTLLDSVTACALHSTLPRGKGFTSIEIKVNYLKAIRADSGTLTATGTLIKAGARIGFAECAVTNPEGDIVATCSSTLLIFDL